MTRSVTSPVTSTMSTAQKLLAAVVAVLLHLPLFWHFQEGLQRGDSSISTASQSGVTLKLAARPAAKPAAPAPVPPRQPKAPTPPTPPPTAKPKPILAPTPTPEVAEPQPISNRESSDAQEQQVIGGQTMGLGGASASGKNDDALERYKGLIEGRIKRLLQYPHQARMRNQEGIVEITFDVADDGSIASYSITRRSGSPLLDRAAERLFSRLKLPPPDPAILPALAGLTVPVTFELGNM